MKSRIIATGTACALASSAALALSPSEVFERASPGVWAVRGLDAGGSPISYGSAVVVGAGRLVTACSVLAKTRAIQVRRDDLVREAKLEHADAERDMCLLSAQGVASPAAALAAPSQVKIGQRVYVIGVPEKLSLTLSDGMVSGLRSEDPQLPPLQTSAPLSPGMGGAGLFDEQARLIGIATLNVPGRGAQGLNFAMPAHWIAEVPERAKAQLAQLRAQPAQAAAPVAVAVAEGLPSPGSAWKYSYREQRFGAKGVFTVKAEDVSGFVVRESFSPEGASPSQRSFDARELNFAARTVAAGSVAVDWAPYFLGEPSRTALSKASFTKYPGNPPVAWKIARAQIIEEQVIVPAGSFGATRVQVAGFAPPSGIGGIARFVHTAWYSPEVKRYVKARHQTWNGTGGVVGDEVFQLVEHRPASTTAAQAAATAIPAAATTIPAAATAIPAAAATPAAAAASDGLPPVGATWKYSFRDQRLSRREQLFTVRVTGVDGWEVRESFVPADGVPVAATLNAKGVRFDQRNIGGYSVIELAPYFLFSEIGKAAPQSPEGYPSTRKWRVGETKVFDEEVRVPSGVFKALRVEVTGVSDSFGTAANDFTAPTKFQYTAWYAPEVKRYVMLRHQAWSRTGAKVADELVRLVEYSATGDVVASALPPIERERRERRAARSPAPSPRTEPSTAAAISAPAQGPRTELPTAITVAPPAPDVPAATAAYSGVWVGKWAGKFDHTLVVEKIEAKSASLVYSLDPEQMASRGAQGWRRVNGSIDGNGVLHGSFDTKDGPVSISYWLSPDRATLLGERNRSGRVTTGMFVRGQLPAGVRVDEAPSMANQ